MKRSVLTVTSVVATVLGIGLVGITSANAATLFDRGLPAANLNNSAGGDRSNVQWADGESTDASSTFWLPGDDFTLAGTGPYNVNTIRIWSKDSTGLSLLGGLAGGSIALAIEHIHSDAGGDLRQRFRLPR